MTRRISHLEKLEGEIARKRGQVLVLQAEVEALERLAGALRLGAELEVAERPEEERSA